MLLCMDKITGRCLSGTVMLIIKRLVFNRIYTDTTAILVVGQTIDGTSSSFVFLGRYGGSG